MSWIQLKMIPLLPCGADDKNCYDVLDLDLTNVEWSIWLFLLCLTILQSLVVALILMHLVGLKGMLIVLLVLWQSLFMQIEFFFFFFFLFNEYRALKYIYGTLLWGIGIGKELILSDPDTEFHAYLIKIHQARKSEKVSDSTLFTFHIIIMLGIIANFTSNTNILELSESLVHKHDTTKLERKKKHVFAD